MRRLFFHEESIHEVSRRYLEHEYVHTDKPKPICPPLFQSWGHKKCVCGGGGGGGEGAIFEPKTLSMYLKKEKEKKVKKKKKKKIDRAGI